MMGQKNGKNSSTFLFGKEIQSKQAGEGITRKVLAYSENMMVCWLELAKGAVIPMHSHIHEQSTTVVSGKCLYTIGGETKELHAGDCVMIGADVPHEITVLEDMAAVDVFSPMREDFLTE